MDKSTNLLATTTKQWWYYPLIGLMALFLLLVPTYWLFIKPRIESYILEKLRNEMGKEGISTCQSIDLNLFSNELKLAGVQLKNKKEEDINGYDFECANLRLAGMHWLKIFFEDKLVINSIHLDSPILKAFGSVYSAKADSSTTKSAGGIRQLTLKKITLENAQVAYYSDEQKVYPRINIDSLNMQLEGIVFSQDSSSQKIDAKAILFDYQQASVRTKNKLYQLNSGAVTANSKEGTIQIQDLELEPLLSERQFAAQLQSDKARLELHIPTIEVSQIDLLSLILKGDCHIGKLNLQSPKLYAFKDKTYPHKIKYKKLPHQSLREMNRALHIDTLAIKNGSIGFKMKSKRTGNIGEIYFQDIYASVYHLSNNPVFMEDKRIVVDTRSKFLGEGLLKAQFQLDPFSTDYSYHFKGQFGSMALASINPVVEPILNMRVKTGQVHSIDFDVAANDHLAKGDMVFQYDELKVSLLEDSGKEKKALLSGLANLAVIDKSNLRADKDFQTAEIYYERDKSRSIFHHMWHALLTGLKSTVLHNYLLDDNLKHFKPNQQKKGWFKKKKK